MLRTLLMLLPLTLLLGCLTGDSYPQQYANAFCSSLFTCVEDTNSIDTFLGYDDEDECVTEKKSDIESSSWYDEYEEGERVYDADNGDACLKEINEIRDDADCGSMGLLEFGLDASDESCTDVFPEATE